MQGNKDDTWSMDTVENTVELPFTYRAMVSNTFRPPPSLKAISTVLPPSPRSRVWLAHRYGNGSPRNQNAHTSIPNKRAILPSPPLSRSSQGQIQPPIPRQPEILLHSPPVINYASFKSWFSSIQGLRNDYTRVYTRVLGWKWRVTDSNLTRESYFPREIFEISRLQKRIRLLIISVSVLSKYRSDHVILVDNNVNVVITECIYSRIFYPVRIVAQSNLSLTATAHIGLLRYGA